MKEEVMKKKSRKKKVNMNRKKVLIVGVAVLVIMLGVIIYMVSRKQENPNSNTIQNIQQVVKNKTEENQNSIQVKNVKIESEGSKIKGTAKIINKGQAVNNLKISLVLYDEKNMMRGNNNIIIESLQAGEEKEISVEIIGSYTEVKTYQFKIEK